MSREEVSAKYRLNAGLALDDAALETFETNVINVDDHHDLTAAFALLASAASAPAGA